MTLYQVRLLSNRLPEMFRFYRDAIGLKPTFGDENSSYSSLEFDGGGALVALFSREEMAQVVGTTSLAEHGRTIDQAAIVIHVSDVDGFFEKLTSLDVEIIRPPADMVDWGIRCGHLRDPDGNLIEVYSDLA